MEIDVRRICKYPGCGKNIPCGQYCDDDCYRYHRAELNKALIHGDGQKYKMNEVDPKNLEKWN